jgi:monofunctional biosynthetic peptidoglycan transglycosylase
MKRRRRRGCGLLLALAGIALAGFALATALRWPDVGALARRNPASTAFIDRYRAACRDRGEPDTVAWIWVGYERIAPELKRAVLVGEDIGFFGHHGFETTEIRRALEEAWQEKSFPRGASTITQQTAKNLWLSPSANPFRKLREALLTRELEKKLSKRRILEIYLNIAEFGPGVYGAEAASRRYFGKPAAALDAEESARLAAGLPRPSRWHPGVSSRAYERRVRRILRRMEQATFLGRQVGE